MRRIFVVLLMVGVVLFAWQQDASCEEKAFFKILGIRVGSSGQMFTSKVAEIINQAVPEISCTVLTGSSQENPINVQKKRGEAGFTDSKYAKQAYDGVGPYKGSPCQNLRDWFFFVITLDNWLVRADSDIKRIEDLKDKKVCVGPKGYGLTDHALATLEAYGLTPEMIRKNGGNIIYASDKDASRMIQDKVVDAIFAHSGKSSIISYNLPAEQSVGLRPLDYDEDKLDKVLKTLGFGAKMEIDGGVYKAQPKPVRSFGMPYIYVIDKDVPEELVYKMTKAVFGHQEEIRKAMGPFYNPFKLDNALFGSTIPVHPGALKFYKEAGIAK